MVYSPTESSDLFLILGCMTSNVLVLKLFQFYYSSLWRTGTIVFAKLDKPPRSLLSLPSDAFEINKLPGVLIEDLLYLFTKALLTFPPVESDLK